MSRQLETVAKESAAVRSRLEGEMARLDGRLVERDGAISRLKETSTELDKARLQLQARLDARRQLGIFPKRLEERDGVAVLPVSLEYADSRPELDATAVLATIPVTIVNNDDYPTTLLRLWLRVRDPFTSEEIVPLPPEELAAPAIEGVMPPEEKLQPEVSMIEARGKCRLTLDFRHYYPRTVLQWAREGKAQEMITLCVTASGLDTTCCSLPQEFFASRPMRSVDLRPSTASEQDTPSSRGSSEE